MLYKFTDLGLWNLYTPDVLPDGAPPKALFARREGDGVDWYEFARKEAETFDLGTVYATALPITRGGVTGFSVAAVQRDITMLFPGGSRLLKVEGVAHDEEFPHKLFERQNYDPEAGTITPFPADKGTVLTYKREMWARMTDEEAEILDADLAKQPVRIRRQFEDAQYIDHSDPLFAMMYGAIEGHFGKERADAILAPSK